MKKISAFLSTGKKCTCGGEIIELFSTHYGKSNGIIGPGGHTPAHEQSDGFACKECGLQYGKPVFHGTPVEKIPDQIKFELTIYERVLKRPITIDDFKPIEYYKKSRKDKKGRQTLIPSTKRIKTIPKEIKRLKEGDVVYCKPSYTNDPHNRYATIQLEKLMNSKTYNILYECFV